jgi:hypothetical protein
MRTSEHMTVTKSEKDLSHSEQVDTGAFSHLHKGGFFASGFDIDVICTEILKTPVEKLKSGECNELIETAIQCAAGANHYDIVRKVAFALFSGRKSMFSQHQRLLNYVLIAASREEALSELTNQGLSLSHKSLVSVLRQAWNDWKKEERHITQDLVAKPRIYEGIYNDGDVDKLITVTYGGGYEYLNAFLKKVAKGYALDHYKGEFPGYGIYVCPGGKNPMANRSYAYALRASCNSFDVPVVLKAEVAIKYLVATPNSSYECGLPTEHVDKLQIISMTKYPYEKFNLKECFGELEMVFNEIFDEYADEVKQELLSVYDFYDSTFNFSFKK